MRCSVCAHVFTVRRDAAAELEWKIRTIEGDQYNVPDLEMVRSWIEEGRIDPRDEISRTGKVWLAVGEMPELADMFMVGEVGPGSVLEPMQPMESLPGLLTVNTQDSGLIRLPKRDSGMIRLPEDDDEEGALLAPPPPFAGEGRVIRREREDSASPASAPPEFSRAKPPSPPPAPAVDLRAPAKAADSGPSKAAGGRGGAARSSEASGAFDVREPSIAQAARVTARDPGPPTPPGSPPLPAGRPPSSEMVGAGRPSVAVTQPQPAAAVPAAAPTRPTSAPVAAAASVAVPPAQPAYTPPPQTAPPPSQYGADGRLLGDARDRTDAHATPRRRVPVGVIALVGVLAGAAVVFGQPDLRRMVLSLGQPAAGTNTEAKAVPRVLEVDAAIDARVSMGQAEVARAEAKIQRALDSGAHTPEELAELRLAQLDLLSARALAYQMAAALRPQDAEALNTRANDDLQRAKDTLAMLEKVDGLGERLTLARAQLKLAQARDRAEIDALLPPSGADELRLMVEAAPYWSAAGGAVGSDDGGAATGGEPAGLPEPNAAMIDGLRARSSSGLAASALLVVYVRTGRTPEASRLAAEIIERTDDHLVARAVEAGTGAGGSVLAVAGKADTAAAEVVQDPGGSSGSKTPEGTGKGGTGKSESGKGETSKGETSKGEGDGKTGGGGSSFSALLEKGCSQVENGSAQAGISTLLKAFDRQPTDLDVLTCLAQGYDSIGDRQRALTFYEKALKQSPRHIIALRGAASVSAKNGSVQKAVGYYERLLKVKSDDATAKAYIAEHGSTAEAGSGGGGGDGGGSEEAGDGDAP